MNNYKKDINYLFYDLIKKDIHPIFKDIYNVNQLAKDYEEYQSNFISNKANVEFKETKFNELNIEKIKMEILKNSEFKKIEKHFDKNNKLDHIHNSVKPLAKKVIKSNVDNESKLYKQIKNENKVLIMGAGPIGLYLACYLKLKFKKLNVVIYDNRIYKENFRKPFTRHRIFVTNPRWFTTLFKNNLKLDHHNFLSINIYLLEYILYFFALFHYNVNFIYKDYEWKDYKKIIKENKIKCVIDASGGKINIGKKEYDEEYTKEFIKDEYLFDEKLDLKFEVYEDKNLMVLENISNKKHFRLNTYYLSVLIYDENNLFKSHIDLDLNDIDDMKFFCNLNRKMYDYDNILKVIQNSRNNVTRNYLYNILKNKNKKNIFMINVWKIYIRHCIQPSFVLKDDDHEYLLLLAGDSLFHSHYIIGAGINRTLQYTLKCINIIKNLFK
jgi:hypothetical protein